MKDPLYFSAWLRGYSPLALPVYFKKALQSFPVSKLRPGGVLRVHALNANEPPLLEEVYDAEIQDWQLVISRAQEFLHQDCGFFFDTHWDLWRWDDEWSLQPERATLCCYGPQFECALGENLSVEFEEEALFLPNPNSDQLRPVQSNLRSLVRLASELEENLPMTRRTLWSEERENFADFVAELLA
jgi:hypothetical protein